MKNRSRTESWVDELAVRSPLRPANSTPSETSSTDPDSSGSDEGADFNTITTIRNFKESPAANPAVLTGLQPSGTVVIFTPVILPANSGNIEHSLDPFEALGRALACSYERLQHVPYVPKVGFTKVHEVFIGQADAVITVVCEPDRDKDQSVSRQMQFAKDTLLNTKGKETKAAVPSVMLRCGKAPFVHPTEAEFANIVHSPAYNAEVAKQLAHRIFESVGQFRFPLVEGLDYPFLPRPSA